ncbi:hypothetical protein FEM48_Zijuj10G0059300 [Ziziphus jujuba var. spinosa]|uniref:WAT1-related protein n=1 Tax=Ziziphus jujuba var. spinosa TaxID=714518 RepID=A0A978ULP7_ZIZJJ|nr:hypothetical protein FEM48_Zijuj10G0059300 [Ziziphus jujuba var. spinosa]
MEVLDLRKKSSQAKSVGTIISIAGALIVTLYKGVRLTSASPLPGKFLDQLLLSIQSKWVIAGFILLLQSFSLVLTFVVQAWVMREYFAELMATVFCCISVTIISAIVALIAERSNPDAWQIKSNIELIAIGFNAVFVVAFRKAVHLWAVCKKGPIYLAMFKPLRLVIAFIFGIIFLGETIYLGRVIGGASVSGGFYAVIWGKA